MRPIGIWLFLLFAAVCLTLAVHHSSLRGHADRHHHGRQWSLELQPASDASEFLITLNKQLSRGAVALYRTVAGEDNVIVVEADVKVSPADLAAVLTSEQLAGRIKWFNRDGVSMRRHH